MDKFWFDYDGEVLSIYCKGLDPEEAISFLEKVRKLGFSMGTSTSGSEVGGHDGGHDGGNAEAVHGRPEEPVRPTEPGRKRRTRAAVVKDEEVPKDTGVSPNLSHVVPRADGGVPAVPHTNDPWGLVPPGTDPNSYRGADSASAPPGELRDTPPWEDTGSEVVPDPNGWTREMIEKKGRLREIVEYLFLCNVNTSAAQAKILNQPDLRDNIGLLARIPADDMQKRIEIVMESLGIDPVTGK